MSDAWHMSVIREKDGEDIRFNRDEVNPAFKFLEILFRVVRYQGLACGYRTDSYLLGAFGKVLDVNVFSVAFYESFRFLFGGIFLDNGECPLSSDFIFAYWKSQKLFPAEKCKSLFKLRMHGMINSTVFQCVVNQFCPPLFFLFFF